MWCCNSARKEKYREMDSAFLLRLLLFLPSAQTQCSFGATSAYLLPITGYRREVLIQSQRMFFWEGIRLTNRERRGIALHVLLLYQYSKLWHLIEGAQVRPSYLEVVSFFCDLQEWAVTMISACDICNFPLNKLTGYWFLGNNCALMTSHAAHVLVSVVCFCVDCISRAWIY